MIITFIFMIVIVLVISSGLFLYASLKCEDDTGCVLFLTLAIFLLLVANVLLIAGIFYKFGVLQ